MTTYIVHHQVFVNLLKTVIFEFFLYSGFRFLRSGRKYYGKVYSGYQKGYMHDLAPKYSIFL